MNKRRVPTNANSAVTSTSIPEDRALDALVTGRRTFSRMTRAWKDAHIDAHIYDLPENAQPNADSIAQKFAHDLESYLYSCPPPQSILLAGELIRGLLYESMIREIPYELEPLFPMTTYATRSRVSHTADRARKTRAVGRPRRPGPKGAFKPKTRGKTSQQ